MADRSPPRFLHLPTVFHFEEREWYVEETGVMQLQIGSGVVLSDATFCRVKDVWFSFDHHGRHPEGLHVFLERASIDASLVEEPDPWRSARRAAARWARGASRE